MKELAPKPSDAIRAMIEGLESHKKWRGFQIDMSTFGKTKDLVPGVCFGCAATCCIMQLAGLQFDAMNINEIKDRANAVGVDQRDIDQFEIVIDSFRRGMVYDLFYYYGLIRTDMEPYRGEEWSLTTEDWRDELPMVKRYLERLIEAGL